MQKIFVSICVCGNGNIQIKIQTRCIQKKLHKHTHTHTETLIWKCGNAKFHRNAWIDEIIIKMKLDEKCKTKSYKFKWKGNKYNIIYNNDNNWVV